MLALAFLQEAVLVSKKKHPVSLRNRPHVEVGLEEVLGVCVSVSSGNVVQVMPSIYSMCGACQYSSKVF